MLLSMNQIKMKFSKKGSLGVGNISVEGLMYGLVGIMVIAAAASTMLPQVQTYLTVLCNSGIPFASMFSPSGVIVLAIVAGIVISFITYALSHIKKR